ncbi:hypothetical protein DSUL_140055 [Desulfovibrionales bacterium]
MKIKGSRSMNKKVTYMLLVFIIFGILGLVIYEFHLKQWVQPLSITMPVLGTTTVPVPGQATKVQSVSVSQLPAIQSVPALISQEDKASASQVSTPISPFSSQTDKAVPSNNSDELVQIMKEDMPQQSTQPVANVVSEAAKKVVQSAKPCDLSSEVVKAEPSKSDQARTELNKTKTKSEIGVEVNSVTEPTKVLAKDMKVVAWKKIEVKATARDSLNRIIKFRMDSTNDSLVLHVVTQRPIKAVNHFTLVGPNRLVVDLPGSWQGKGMPISVKPALVKAFRTGKHLAMYRIVADLTAAVQTEVSKKSPTELMIMIRAN